MNKTTPNWLTHVPEEQHPLLAQVTRDIAASAGLQHTELDRRLTVLASDDADTQAAFAQLATPMLTQALDSPSAIAALNHFSRFAEAAFSQKWLYDLLVNTPELTRRVLQSLGASSYLSDILIRNPEFFFDILNPSIMEVTKTQQFYYDELGELLEEVPELDGKLNEMRRYKRLESLRIGVRDLLEIANLETVTLELSGLADATLQHCYELGRDVVLKPRFGTPLNEDGDAPAEFVVIGMGKLGGSELNFSSDIDLLFVYSDDGFTDTGTPNYQYYARLCEFIIKAMSEIKSEGYVFRVDIRLRPESSAGVIARSMESYESYYEGWGELWERQALIKARPVAGDVDTLGEEFIRMIQPFVYQRYLDGVTLSEIKADIRGTKARIEERIVSEKGDLQKHIKLGPGAIRDIEFTCQCLQMIHGGKRKSLCSQNTLLTLAALEENELLSPDDVEALASAYRFLRTVEHRIQIEADQQRYSIPDKEEEERELARRAGYRSTKDGDELEAFRRQHRAHTERVRAIFEEVTSTALQHEDTGVDIGVLLAEDETQELDELLRSYGFENVKEAQRLLRRLANGGDGVQFSPGVRRSFFTLAPTLLNVLRDSPNPDMALRYLSAFADKVGARSSYYTMFLEKPSTLEALTGVCGTSLYLAELLVTSPELFDLLTVPDLVERAKTLDEKQAEALKIVETAPSDKMLPLLRRYKNDEIWRIALRNILGNASLPTTTTELSDLAEAVTQALYPQVEAQIRDEHGIPLNAEGNPVTFAVIGLGKFGGRELNFSSDLDILFVYSEDGETTKGTPNANYFSALGLELVKQLAGDKGMSIYELDLRLRPHGKGGAIAMPLEGYQHYYDNTALIWERQALTRARPVAGDMEGVGARFLDIAHGFAYGQPLTPEGIAEIVRTRQRKEAQATRKPTTRRRRRGQTRTPAPNVKSGYGGLVDIEFAVQTLQLVHGSGAPAIREQNTLLAADRLHDIGVLTAAQREALSEAYQYLRRVENALRIVHDRPLDALPTNRSELEQLARRLGYAHTEENPADAAFLEDYGKWTEMTRSLFNELLVQ